jgi:hypothetical protein
MTDKYCVYYSETPYGFQYGAATVTRVASLNGQVVITVDTPRETMTVRVTQTGMIRTSRVSKSKAKVKR